jgi:hypothetical protein
MDLAIFEEWLQAHRIPTPALFKELDLEQNYDIGDC